MAARMIDFLCITTPFTIRWQLHHPGTAPGNPAMGYH
jgi:hypothetical protein